MTEVPKMYDIKIDDHRPITQADVDRWQDYEQALGCYFRGTDLIFSAYRMTVEGKMDWREFSALLKPLQDRVGYQNLFGRAAKSYIECEGR